MRLVVLLGIVLLAGLCGVCAQSADDKFMICPFLEFGNCLPLTDAAVQDRSPSREEKQIIEKLRRLASAPDNALLEDIAKSFGDPQRPYAPAGFVSLWYPDLQDDRAQPKCFACGLHLVLHNDELIQINYGMKGKFMLIWNNPPAAPQPK